MNIDIRNYIISNFKDDDKEMLKSSILDSIKDKDEEVLPGLGVLFELLWNNSDDDLKDEILEILINSIKNS